LEKCKNHEIRESKSGLLLGAPSGLPFLTLVVTKRESGPVQLCNWL